MMRNDSTSFLPVLAEQLLKGCSSLPFQLIGATSAAGLDIAGATFRGASSGLLRTTSMIVRPALSLVLPSANSHMYELDEQSKFSYTKGKACKVLKSSCSSSRAHQKASRLARQASSTNLNFGMPSARPQIVATPQREVLSIAIGLQAMQASML